MESGWKCLIYTSSNSTRSVKWQQKPFQRYRKANGKRYFSRSAKNRELATLSEIDMLSQLYNRLKIDQIMREALAEVTAQPTTSLSLILLDIDLFKDYNDCYGHLVGDQVIRKVAELLMKSAWGNDYIGRWGGEEFIIICKQTNAHDASIIAERLSQTIETTPFETVNKVTCSFGVFQYRTSDGADSLLKRTDEALYLSKRSWSKLRYFKNL